MEDRDLAMESFRRKFFRYVDRALMSAVNPELIIIYQLLSDSRMVRSSV